MEERQHEKIEQRLQELELERSALLESLKLAKRENRYSGKRLELDLRLYPETSEKRVELFGQIFAARKDVYPQYWENLSSGKKGYSPVCESVWNDGRKLKASEVFSRYGKSKFRPLDRQVLEAHLRGQRTVGTYAIRPDDTCIFLAADFDNDGWHSESLSLPIAMRQQRWVFAFLLKFPDQEMERMLGYSLWSRCSARDARALGSLLVGLRK